MAQCITSGVVTDHATGRALSHVSVLAAGGEPHTVTNDDGRFVLKTQEPPAAIVLSHIGYQTLQVSLTGQTGDLNIQMVPSTVKLDEVFVIANDPQEIVRAAIAHIKDNYPRQPELVRCFYRETAHRGQRFIAVAEAVTEMYKTDYRQQTPDHDAIAIVKGRRLVSMKPSDTLAVKLQGGPVIPIMADVAKNPDFMLNEEDLARCKFHMLVPEQIDNRPHYVIGIEPVAANPYPLMGGRLYIDQATLAISRAELQLDMSDWRLASGYMLIRKPIGLHFRPRELSTTIVYHTDQAGVTTLSYIRSEMRFNCEWHRRLFSSAYTVVSEMVVTDRLQQGHDARRPRGNASFGIRERFYDRVDFFNDPDFWADYNIIAPTESLEHAIDKLKKRARN
jgi:hypothetical protein